MMPMVCVDAVAMLFLFDLTNPSTLLSVREWYRQVRGLNKVRQGLPGAFAHPLTHTLTYTYTYTYTQIPTHTLTCTTCIPHPNTTPTYPRTPVTHLHPCSQCITPCSRVLRVPPTFFHVHPPLVLPIPTPPPPSPETTTHGRLVLTGLALPFPSPGPSPTPHPLLCPLQSAIPLLVGTKYDIFYTYERSEQEEIIKQVCVGWCGGGVSLDPHHSSSSQSPAN